MTEAIKLMMIPQIRKRLVHTVDDVIGVKIPVVLLCRAYDVDRLICDPLQLLVRMVGQRIAHRLDPLGKIAVLKNKSVELVLQMVHILRQSLKPAKRILRLRECRPFRVLLLHQLPGNLEIAHTKARCSPLYTIV